MYYVSVRVEKQLKTLKENKTSLAKLCQVKQQLIIHRGETLRSAASLFSFSLRQLTEDRPNQFQLNVHYSITRCLPSTLHVLRINSIVVVLCDGGGGRGSKHLMQRGVAVGVSGVQLGALGEKQQHHREVSEPTSEVQRRVSDSARHIQPERETHNKHRTKSATRKGAWDRGGKGRF